MSHSKIEKDAVRIAGVQGFYGDSPAGAIDIARAGAADYLVHDALAELTLSILQKDRERDASLGYARDIELLARLLYPLAFRKGIKIVSNSGGLNPLAAARKVSAILAEQGLHEVRIAAVWGDDMIQYVKDQRQVSRSFVHMESGEELPPELNITHANVYTGAAGIVAALGDGADIILAGRVADPCLTLGILVHHFGWNLKNASSRSALDRLASGIAVGHVLECGGQASGGNSYAQWPPDYSYAGLAYPIARVAENGSASFSIIEDKGGKLSRDSIREQLVYEIHDPANYLTPDVTVDLTQIELHEDDTGHVQLHSVIGKPAPDKLKMTLGYESGLISEQFFFVSAPFAFDKAKAFVKAVRGIWNGLPADLSDHLISIVGFDGIHIEAATPQHNELLNQMNEFGIRLALRHSDKRTGQLAFASIVCLGLNGPPGLIGMPSWGRKNRRAYGLWPSLLERNSVSTNIRVQSVSEWLDSPLSI